MQTTVLFDVLMDDSLCLGRLLFQEKVMDVVCLVRV